MLAGLALLAAAGALAACNLLAAARAGAAARAVVARWPAAAAGSAGTESDALQEADTVVIDGRAYLGLLEISRLELTLPVQAECTDEALALGPCRWMGGPAGRLVIAGHNYAGQFGALGRLARGDAVAFTDAGGTVRRYTVAAVQRLSGTDAAAMAGGGWDLTLFTCTLSGGRLAVRCTAA